MYYPLHLAQQFSIFLIIAENFLDFESVNGKNNFTQRPLNGASENVQTKWFFSAQARRTQTDVPWFPSNRQFGTKKVISL